MQAAKEAVDQQAADLTAQVEALTAKETELQATIDSLTAEVSQLTAGQDAQQVLATENQTLIADKEELTAANTDLTAQVKALEDEKAALEVEKNTLSAEIAALTEQLATLKADVSKPVVVETEQTAVANGFCGDVTVHVVLKDGVITKLTVDTPDETPALGGQCSEEAFTSQFIGKSLPVTLGDGIDAVSGATITSTAVVEALNSLK